MLPDPYDKTAQPFEHFDNPEDLARARVRSEIENGSHEQHHDNSNTGWYGHHTRIHGDKLTVLACAGVEMEIEFNYRRMVIEEMQKAFYKSTLFATT